MDFELAPAQPAAATAAGGPVRSRPLTAPARFNLLGLRWRGRSEPRVALRVRRDGRRWSRWQRVEAHADHNPDRGTGERSVAASDPVWVGEADQVQYRMSRRVPGLRIHFVNVEGTATPGDRVRTALRRAANTAVSTVAAGGDRGLGERPGADHRAADRAPPRLGREQMPAAGGARLRHRARRVRPPHRLPERLHAGGGPLDRPGHLPVPPQLERVERHRLPGAGGQVRHALRGTRRRPQPGRARCPGPGVQRREHRHRQHRRQHLAAAPGRGHGVTRVLPALEALPARRAALGARDAHERGRGVEQVRGGAPRARSARARPPRHEQHGLPGLGPLRPARRPESPRGHRRVAARLPHAHLRGALRHPHRPTGGASG